MTNLCTVLLLLLISGCGAVDRRDCYISGTECESKGAPGETGNTGDSGRDGSGGVVGATGPRGDSTVGPNGATGGVGDTGATGGGGVQGSQGVAGEDGTTCSVVQDVGGATITCSDGSSAYIADGADGLDAPFAISEVRDPCGDGPGPDEVILIFATGEWVAWYQNLGLSILTPGGTYQTTDQQACVFTVPL